MGYNGPQQDTSIARFWRRLDLHSHRHPRKAKSTLPGYRAIPLDMMDLAPRRLSPLVPPLQPRKSCA